MCKARIKFPYREGTQWGFFPAFWTWIGRGVPPETAHNAAEIDICEIFGSKHLDDSTVWEL